MPSSHRTKYFTQTVMAILVYGAAALIIGTGLIGAIRRH